MKPKGVVPTALSAPVCILDIQAVETKCTARRKCGEEEASSQKTTCSSHRAHLARRKPSPESWAWASELTLIFWGERFYGACCVRAGGCGGYILSACVRAYLRVPLFYPFPSALLGEEEVSDTADPTTVTGGGNGFGHKFYYVIIIYLSGSPLPFLLFLTDRL